MGLRRDGWPGLPPSVIKRAKQVMKQIEQHSKIAVGLRKGNTQPHARKSSAETEAKTQQFELPF